MLLLASSNGRSSNFGGTSESIVLGLKHFKFCTILTLFGKRFTNSSQRLTKKFAQSDLTVWRLFELIVLLSARLEKAKPKSSASNGKKASLFFRALATLSTSSTHSDVGT